MRGRRQADTAGPRSAVHGGTLPTDARFHATEVERDCFRSPCARLSPAPRQHFIAGARSRARSTTWNFD